jgi:hypothetical protein
MWNFLYGFLFARATGISRFIRPVLWLLLIGLVAAAIIYAAMVFNAFTGKDHKVHVQPNSSH